MSCNIGAPNGGNGNCKTFLSEAIAAVVTDPSFSWDSVGAVDNIENLRILLQETRKGFILELNGSEPTAPEATVETTGYGDSYITAENAPTYIGYTEGNPCDFVQLLQAYKGGTYNVAFILNDGSIMVADKKTKYQGFQTQVFAHRFGVPGRENQTQQFKVTFNFLKGAEFDNYKVIGINYTVDELLDYIPLGLTADVATAYDPVTGVIVLDVYTRCVADDIKEGVMTVEVSKATKGVAVTGIATDDTGGKYSVTLTVGAGQLGTGEYAEFELVTKTGDVYDEISNTIQVRG